MPERGIAGKQKSPKKRNALMPVGLTPEPEAQSLKPEAESWPTAGAALVARLTRQLAFVHSCIAALRCSELVHAV